MRHWPWLLAVVLVAAACTDKRTIPTTHADKIHVVVALSDEAAKASSATEVLGTGWYANVEVDAQDRIHVAYTDADMGDVFYAVSPATALNFEARQPVEVGGAVGGYVQLALAPGDVPVLSYYHQDQRTLRLAHRAKDLEAMKAAGAVVDLTAPPPADPADMFASPNRYTMGDGWDAEDVTFGDHVGLGGRLFVDDAGFPHITYYARGRRFRYARRVVGAPAFGTAARERFELLDVDEKASSSYTMTTGLVVTTDQSVAVSYCNWNFVESQLKFAVLKKGDHKFSIVERPLERGVDGWHSAVFENGPRWRVFFIDGAEKALSEIAIGKTSGQWTPPQKLLQGPGAFVIRLADDGTIWALTRGQAAPRLGNSPGVWLLEYPKGDLKAVRRIVLDEGRADDPWLDLALRPNGRPVAVWTASDHRSMKLYVH